MLGVKNDREIALMRKAGAIVRDVLSLVEEKAKPGVSTKELDTIAYDYIKRQNAVPSFLNYNGFPATICASIDSEVVHGIPSARILEEGMLLKVDAGACFGGYHSDAARTVIVGTADATKQKLASVCRESFFAGIQCLKDGARLGTLGYTIQSYVEKNGFSVVRSLVGHGIGRKIHEAPGVPNFGNKGKGFKLVSGMTIAIEPMINAGVKEVKMLADNWTVVTADGAPSAHYENTVLVTESGVEILTL